MKTEARGAAAERPDTPLSAATATAQDRANGYTLMTTSAAANQIGASLGAMAFPVIGPVGVVSIRQVFAALFLPPIARPRFWRFTRSQWLPILGLALALSVMNLTLYASIDRIGLGLAVTLEFLGPLGVAVAGSRRLIDLLCALLAGAGVVVLTNPGPSTDVLGVTVGLIAACAWAAYILLNRTLGQRLPGIEGTATASMVAACAWIPIGVWWFSAHPPTLAVILLALGCGLGSSIVPYVTDLQALRRVSAQVFGTFTSINPVFAALAGLLFLGQALQLNEWIGMAIIVAANVIVSARSFRASKVNEPVL